MKRKIKKMASKTLLILPIAMLLIDIIFGLEKTFISLFFMGFITSFGIIFWNWFDYEKFNKISNVDFMESTHKLTIENTIENWNSLNKFLNSQIIEYNPIIITENVIKVQITRKFIDSVLLIEKKDSKLNLSIKRNYFSILPDLANNYQLLMIVLEKTKAQ